MASVSSGMQLPPGFNAILMQTSPLLTQLMEALRCLPGVGPKSAQRMAFTLLQRGDRSGGISMAQALTRAMSEIGHCADCRTLADRKSVTSVRIRVVRKTVKSVWWRVRRTSTPLSRRGSFQAVILC